MMREHHNYTFINNNLYDFICGVLKSTLIRVLHQSKNYALNPAIVLEKYFKH